jgi:hypothetical protein
MNNDEEEKKGNKEEKKGFWRSWMTIAILITLTIMVAILFNGRAPYIPQNENISTISNSGNSNVTAIDNDTFFKSSANVNIGVMSEDLKCISDAGKSKDFNGIEKCGKLLSEDANLSLKHAEYNVSSPLQLSLKEYRDALEYYNIGGAKLEIGSRNRNVSQMAEAIGYIQNGTARISMVTYILNNENTVPSATAFVHPRIASTST